MANKININQEILSKSTEVIESLNKLLAQNSINSRFALRVIKFKNQLLDYMQDVEKEINVEKECNNVQTEN
jgi:hypothetical protein